MWHRICYHSGLLAWWQGCARCRRCRGSLRRLPGSRARGGHPHAVHILSLLPVILTVVLSRLQELSLHLRIALWIPVTHLLPITVCVLSRSRCHLFNQKNIYISTCIKRCIVSHTCRTIIGIYTTCTSMEPR